MRDFLTFSGAGWSITTVADPYTRDTTRYWNIVNGVTYPFLSWQHSLTMAVAPVGGGTATDLTAAPPYPAGTVVNIKAEAATGFRFVNWTAPAGTFGNPTAATTTFAMPAQGVTITANFVRQLNLTTSSTAGGTVTTPGVGTFTYDEGTVVPLAATPDAGFQFVNWTAVPAVTFVNPTATTTTFTMPAQDVTVTANFVALFDGGDGSSGNPFQITNWHHLNNVRHYLGSHFILMNNLDSGTDGYGQWAGSGADGGAGWLPLGDAWPHLPFTGNFDGREFEIRDLFINRPANSGVGLFGVVGAGGVIKNVGLVNANVTGDRHVGGLVGWNEGTVSNSSATGSVSGYSWVGGLVGYNMGAVSNSSAGGSVTGRINVGGLAGLNDFGSSISNSSAGGSVNGEQEVGGLVGYNMGAVSNSHASGSVTGTGPNVGGLVGDNRGTVTYSSATGSVSGDHWVGGLVGANVFGGSITNSSAGGNVSGGNDIGGLVGVNYYAVAPSAIPLPPAASLPQDGLLVVWWDGIMAALSAIPLPPAA
jgi:hypothetical protein